ncbi:MAG: hypothetical protein EAZ61_11565 [Oscillatoriales cyanobacterium]|nr:MAG: hypothetical protein EAZ61_11565 [Oscillatoriales cyanobacterium]
MVSSCGSDTPEATGEDPAASAPASAPANAPDAANADDTKAQPFDSPTVAAREASTPGNGLIGSTNSKERAIQVQRNIQANQKNKGNTNPFGLLPVKAIPDVAENSLAAGGNGSGSKQNGPPLPALNPQSGEPTPDLPFPIIPLVSSIPYIPPLEISPQGRAPISSPTSVGRAPASTSSPAAPSASPPRSSNPPAAAPPAAPNFEPPPPSTGLAESIEVLGVVQVGREVQILVRTPDSPLGRYVAVGETVANGQVLIRRVERLQGGGEPVVILVQNGIEVARSVGDTSKPEGDTTANALNDASTIRNSGQTNRLRDTSDTIASRMPLPPLPVPYAP